MKYKLFISGFFLLFLFCGLAGGKARAFEENLYVKTYQQLKQYSHELAMEQAALQLGVSHNELYEFFAQPTQETLDKIHIAECRSAILSDLTACFQLISEHILKQKQSVLRLLEEKQKALASERWANGTLSDSSFDIIVDLNIIDVILFGPEATLPAARLPDGFLQGPYNSRPYTEPLDPLRDPGASPASSDSTNPDPEDPAQNEDPSSDDPDDPAGPVRLMCMDPDALYLESPNHEGQNDDDENNSSGDENTNVSAGLPQPVPDFSQEENDDTYGAYPTLDNIEATQTCTEEETPLFNGMFCVPQFCEDLICIFIETKPGKAFSLAPQETLACISCIVNKGYEILHTLYGVVEAPQDAQNTKWNFRNILSAFVKSKASVTVIKHPVPIDRVSPEQERAIRDVTSDMGNYELAQRILDKSCDPVLDLFPADAVVTTQEFIALCDIYVESKTPRVADIIPEQIGRSIESILAERRQQEEMTIELTSYLQKFKNSITVFTAAVTTFLEKSIQEVDATCSL